MFIGRDGGGDGGGGGGGGVCGANDGDREERGMFSPPPWRRVNTKRQKSKPAAAGRGRGNITSERGGGKLAASTDERASHQERPSPPSLSKPFLPPRFIRASAATPAEPFHLRPRKRVAPSFLKRRDAVALS